MIRYYLLFFLSLCLLKAFGQATELKQVENIRIEIINYGLNNTPDSKKLTEKDIAGTPYLNKNFQNAYILKISGIEVKDMPLRYNIYSNNMEFMKDGNIFAIAFPSEIYRIKLAGKIFIYKQYQNADKIQHSYFEVLYEGNFQLLKKYNTILQIPDKSNFTDSVRFVAKTPDYYLRRGEGKIYPIISQKHLEKILQPVHQPIIDYIKANKINGRDEQKLIGLMEFLDDNEN